MTNIISVSNRLPVVISDGEIKKPSGGLVSALDGVAGGEYVLKRVGWTGSSVADPGRREEIDRLLREQFDSIPVFLSTDEAAGYYEGFSNSSLGLCCITCPPAAVRAAMVGLVSRWTGALPRRSRRSPGRGI